MSDIIQINPAEFGLNEQTAAQIAAQFRPMLTKMEELETEFNAIMALPQDSEDAPKKARELRLKYVKVRTGTAEIHKDQKAFYLAGGRYVDGWKNAQLFASQGKEEKLEAIEKYAENLEKERLARLKAEREQELLPYGVDTSGTDIGRMSNEAYQLFLSGAKHAHDLKIQAEKKADEERVAKEKADAEERERQRLENERLKKEAEEREAQIKAEREEMEKKLAEERRMAEENAKKEREKAEAEHKRIEAEEAEKRRVIEEQARKEKEEAERLAEIERAERKRLEDELNAKREAEEQAERDRVAAIEAEASKGDADKVKDLIADLQSIGTKYSFKSKKNQAMYSEVQALIGKIISHIQK